MHCEPTVLRGFVCVSALSRVSVGAGMTWFIGDVTFFIDARSLLLGVVCGWRITINSEPNSCFCGVEPNGKVQPPASRSVPALDQVSCAAWRHPGHL